MYVRCCFCCSPLVYVRLFRAGQSRLPSFVALAFTLACSSGFALLFDFAFAFDFAFVVLYRILADQIAMLFDFAFDFDVAFVVLYRILADQMGSRAWTTES